MIMSGLAVISVASLDIMISSGLVTEAIVI